MGWLGGSSLMNVIIAAVKANVPSFPLRERIYLPVIVAFDADDWDTQSECLGLDPAFDAAMETAHSDVLGDDDDDEDEEDDDYDDAGEEDEEEEGEEGEEEAA